MTRLRAALHRWVVRHITGGVHDHPEGRPTPDCRGCRDEKEAGR